MTVRSDPKQQRISGRLESRSYSPFQHYLLHRLAELQQRQRDLPPMFQDHPIGRLATASLQDTLEECHWAGLSREAGWILRQPGRSASA